MLKRKLRIAQLVLPWIKIPPPGYAGTEKIVSTLTEELVKRGHQVTLFSVGESRTSAKLEFVYKKAFGLQSNVIKTLRSSFKPWIHVASCFEKQKDFDIIHSHAQFLALPFAAVVKTPSVHTFHRTYQFRTQDETDLVLRYSKLNFISISKSQQTLNLNFIATVYNGVDINKFKLVKNPKRSYLFWAGRVIEKKGPIEAIKIAKALNYPLIMAGKITEPDYFRKYIKSSIGNPLIKHVGEITEEEMVKYFQQAKLTLVPIKWNEPFGLIPVESMACGTPVVAYANGGVRETIIDKKTGFLVKERDGIKKLIEKTKEIIQMTDNKYQKMCSDAREHIIRNFSIKRMAEKYEEVYYKVLSLSK